MRRNNIEKTVFSAQQSAVLFLYTAPYYTLRPIPWFESSIHLVFIEPLPDDSCCAHLHLSPWRTLPTVKPQVKMLQKTSSKEGQHYGRGDYSCCGTQGDCPEEPLCTLHVSDIAEIHAAGSEVSDNLPFASARALTRNWK